MSEINHAAKRILEDFDPVLPDDDIICKDCVFRKPDLVINGRTVVKCYKNGYCLIYEGGKGKPNDILFNGGDCEYYEKE